MTAPSVLQEDFPHNFYANRYMPYLGGVEHPEVGEPISTAKVGPNCGTRPHVLFWLLSRESI
jgi:hypothetical protein